MIDWSLVSKRITESIKKIVEDAGAKGVVVGVSGGVDSSVTACLCTKALSKKKVLAVLMPEKEVTDKQDLKDAVEFCNFLGLKHEIIEIKPIVAAFLKSLGEGSKIAIANLKPRIRMTINYYYANSLNYLVVGTGNKSELMTGYYTKYGDGGVDFLPIGDLYKTEVWQLAEFLGIPEKIIKKKPSAGLWKGQTDEGELGISYKELDLILAALEKKIKPEEIIRKFNIKKGNLEKVLQLIKGSVHKREKPPIIPLRDLID